MFSVISHTKSLYKSYYKAPFISSLLELNPLIRKIYQNLHQTLIGDPLIASKAEEFLFESAT